MTTRIRILIALACVASLPCASSSVVAQAQSVQLKIGFDSADITPDVNRENPVWLAGYGWGRRATGVHDPLYARTLVLSDNRQRIAIVSVDLIGLQYPDVVRIRKRLKAFDYVLISSTHNHEGPDTIGIWGRSPIRRGVDARYIDTIIERIASSVQRASKRLAGVEASFGTATDASLLGDSRLPNVKDAVLRVLRFDDPESSSIAGILVQWNCHPEAMGPKNTLITSDFCHATITRLESTYDCPVVYVSGAVGGLMAPPEGALTDENGRVLKEGEFAFAKAYGRAVADLASKALRSAEPIRLSPIAISSARIAIPVENPLYRTARLAGVLQRKAVAWTGDFRQVDRRPSVGDGAKFAAVSEVACLQLGDLYVASIPGEIYPELVYGQFQIPVDPNVDYPEAPLEPTVVELMPSDKWMLLGLANDELGYIIPRRQWDQLPPFAYGRKRAQYGEINSCSPRVAPIIMKALAERVSDLKRPR